jgi:probable HAF family extracellular repeat protein
LKAYLMAAGCAAIAVSTAAYSQTGVINAPATYRVTEISNGAWCVDLGELPGGPEFGIAQATNDRGQVVGYSAVAELVGGDYMRAVLWENGSIYDLNTLVDPSDPLNGVHLLTQAHGINEHGQIVGCATNLVEGRAVGFLLTPTDVQRQ